MQQGDILGPLQAFELTTLTDGVPSGTLRQYNYAVVLSQDCDLEQDYNSRQETQENLDKHLFGVLLCGAYEADEVRGGQYRPGATQLGGKEWKAVHQNTSPRYQYLGYVPGPNCILVADFKDYFFVPVTYLYEQINQGQIVRMVSMDSPWRDHLLQRFGFYMIRIGLPKDFNALGPPPSPQA